MSRFSKARPIGAGISQRCTQRNEAFLLCSSAFSLSSNVLLAIIKKRDIDLGSA
jgi:hypothetical protein